MKAIIKKLNFNEILPNIDLIVITTVILLIGFGIIMVFSSSGVTCWNKYGDSRYLFYRQAFYGVLGISIMIFSTIVDINNYRKIVYPLLILTLISMIVVLTPLGHSGGGASRWIKLGGFTIQPGEIAKISILLWLAHSLAKKKEKVKSFTIGFLPHILVVGFFVLLFLLQPDFGSAVILTFIAFVLLFSAGTKISYLLLVFIISSPIVYHIITSSHYRMMRITAFLNPFAHRFDVGYQVTESLIGFGIGGRYGLGLGEGRQKLLFLPAAFNDFIASIIGEEFGFVGIIILLILFTILIWRGIVIALKAKTLFSSLVAFGITALIGIQLIINMGVAMGIFPSKGLNMPFVSYGGSSLLVSMWAVGILLSISRQSYDNNKVSEDEDENMDEYATVEEE